MVLFGCQVDDPGVGLVEDEEVHVLNGHTGLFQHLVDAVGHCLNGELEGRLAVHEDAGWRRLLRAGDAQHVRVAVAAQNGVDGGIVLPPLHHHSAGAVSEEDAGAPVLPVDEPGEHLRADHQAVLPGGLGQQALHGVDGEQEAAACGIQVKAHRVVGQPQPPLHHAGGRGGQVVGGESGHHAGADVLRGNPGVFQRLPGGAHAHIRVGLRGAVVAGLDAGAGGDPLVAGIHDFCQVVVGDDFRRGEPAGASDFDSAHASSFWGAAPMRLNF